MATLLAKTPVLQVALAGSVALHGSVLLAMREPPPVAATTRAAGPEEIDLAALDPEPPRPGVVPGMPAASPPPAARHAQVPTAPRTPAHDPVPAATSAQADDAPASPGPASSVPAPPRFVLVVGAAAATPASQTTAGEGGEGAASPVYPPDAVDVPPRFVTWSPPRYPAAAASAGVEVDVPVDVLIDAAGAVTDVHLPRHFGYGLDEAALAAARSYRFTRGMRAGKPVRVRMRCTVTFRLD